MSNIRTALAQLYLREAEIALVDESIRGQEYDVPIGKVWPLMPPSRVVITDTPCFVNLLPASRTQFMSAVLTSEFTVNMRLVVYDSDMDVAGEIALAFYPQIVNKLMAERKLGLTGWMLRDLRTEGEFLREFEEYKDSSGRAFVGLDLFVDMVFKGPANNAGGTPPL